METPNSKKEGARARTPKFQIRAPVLSAVTRNTPERGRKPSEHPKSSDPVVSTSRPDGRAKLRHEDSQVQFVAVATSSPQVEESQLLTERQREVASRQRYQTAHLYPDFSSSPAPTPTSAKSRMPRLDFSAQKPVPENVTTPMLEEHEAMDDYLGLSPTPKANDKGRSKLNQSTLADEDDESALSDDAADSDIPSSPPSMPEDTIRGDTTEIDTRGKLGETRSIDVANTTGEAEDAHGDKAKQDSKAPAHVDDDRIELPTVLLLGDQANPKAEIPNTDKATEGHEDPAEVQGTQEENEAAHNRATGMAEGPAIPSSLIQESEVFVDAPTEFGDDDKLANDQIRDESSSPIDFTDSVPEMTSLEAENTAAEQERNATNPVEAHEDAPPNQDDVKDSFSDGGADDSVLLAEKDDSESQSQNGPAIRRSKRKRTETTKATSTNSTKRRKSANSPLKRIISWVTGSQSQEGDDPDCITVASGPYIPSVSLRETSTAPGSASATADVPDAKRGRGRSRKPNGSVASTASQTPRTRQLKRNISVLSTESGKSLTTDTPGPRKSRRITRSQRSDSVAMEASGAAKRTADAVVISPSKTVQLKQEQLEESDAEGTDWGASSQLHTEHEVAVQRNRVIAQPKSIMDKLKSILADCKTLVLGSTEYRELDDVLFEVRKEVHEAANRGKQ